MATDNIVWHEHAVTKSVRSSTLNQASKVIWLTGLSGSGKSTLSGLLEQRLAAANKHTYLLDGDNVRHGLCGDLGFSDKDRVENIRRVSEVSKLFVDSGLIVLTAFISPFKADREYCRGLLDDGEFVEVFVDVPLAECEKRDPKGLYKKARSGEIKEFTGISSVYEAPETPEIHFAWQEETPQASAERLFQMLVDKGVITL